MDKQQRLIYADLGSVDLSQATANEKIVSYLKEGYEPFAVDQGLVWFRKQAWVDKDGTKVKNG